METILHETSILFSGKKKKRKKKKKKKKKIPNWSSAEEPKSW